MRRLAHALCACLLAAPPAGGRQPSCGQLCAEFSLDAKTTVCFVANANGTGPWEPNSTRRQGTYAVPFNHTVVLQGELGPGLATAVGVRLDVVGASLIVRNVDLSSKIAVTQPTYSGYTIGGAVYVQQGTLRAISSVFRNNTANGFGGGAIFVSRGALVMIHDCVFAGNSARDNSGQRSHRGRSSSVAAGASNSIGGAIAISGVSDHVAITASTFSYNVAGWYGAALYSQDGSNVSVLGCTFLNNSLTHPTEGEASSQGAAVSVWGSTRQLTVGRYP
eukprot:COSAG05_NODE_2408_length_3098_cov_7.489830_1_plen_277_part_00